MLWSKGGKLFISRNVTFLEWDYFYKTIEINNNNILLSNEFVLPCYTNQERREVPVENYAQISTQEVKNHEQTQEEDDSLEEI
jgi:hypothetical protein